jgi:hypothetical protein
MMYISILLVHIGASESRAFIGMGILMEDDTLEGSFKAQSIVQ